MTISEQPFNGVPIGDVNRIRRITFVVGSVKTAAHVVEPTGPLGRYDAARADSTDPEEIKVPKRNTYITEES